MGYYCCYCRHMFSNVNKFILCNWTPLGYDNILNLLHWNLLFALIFWSTKLQLEVWTLQEITEISHCGWYINELEDSVNKKNEICRLDSPLETSSLWFILCFKKKDTVISTAARSEKSKQYNSCRNIGFHIN